MAWRLPLGVKCEINTDAWLAQLVERWTAVLEVEGSSPRTDQHSVKITEEKVLPL